MILLLCRQQEFKALSKSTIHTVMIESNYDYVRSRGKLTGISAKSWRYSVATFFRRKKPENRTQISEPRQTGCEELDAELRELGADKILAQIVEDRRSSGNPLFFSIYFPLLFPLLPVLEGCNIWCIWLMVTLLAK